MTRQAQQEATYVKLWNEMADAFRKFQWFPSSNYYYRRHLSTQSKLQAYDTKYGPFTMTAWQAN